MEKQIVVVLPDGTPADLMPGDYTVNVIDTKDEGDRLIITVTEPVKKVDP